MNEQGRDRNLNGTIGHHHATNYLPVVFVISLLNHHFPNQSGFLHSLHTLTSIGIYRPCTELLLLAFSKTQEQLNFRGADFVHILHFDEVFVRCNVCTRIMLDIICNSSHGATKDSSLLILNKQR